MHGSRRVVDSGSDAVDSGDMESGYTGSGDEEVQEENGEEEPEVMPVPQVRSSAAAGSSSDGAADGAADRYWLAPSGRKAPTTRGSRQSSRVASRAPTPTQS